MPSVNLIEVGPHSASSERYKFSVEDPAATAELARMIADNVQGGMLIGLSGVLGAGKTEFVRGFGAAFGAGGEVSSPSYVLETTYSPAPGRTAQIQSIRHWDLYRLNGVEAPGELFEQYGLAGSVTLVEWPERSPRLQNLLSAEILLTFGDSKTQSEDYREIIMDLRDARLIAGAKKYVQALQSNP